MIRVGLTGGIAAGKSVASARLLDLGATVIDHDLLARAAVAPGSDGLKRVVEHFGIAVLTKEGSLNRPALGKLVFGHDQERAALNAIVHPIVMQLAHEEEQLARERGELVVVHDIPLLIETGQQDSFDHVIVVHTPADLRRTRLINERNLTSAEADQRLAAQISDEDRLRAATIVLDGSRQPDKLRAQVDQVWQTLLAQAHKNA